MDLFTQDLLQFPFTIVHWHTEAKVVYKFVSVYRRTFKSRVQQMANSFFRLAKLLLYLSLIVYVHPKIP